MHNRSFSVLVVLVVAAAGRPENVGSHVHPSPPVDPLLHPLIKWIDSSSDLGVLLSQSAAFEPPLRLRVAPGVRLQRQSTGLRITGAACLPRAALLIVSYT